MGYAALLKGLELAFHVSSAHQAGYICAMLFIIPGFPFITSGIDLAKLDMRSGLERLAYSLIIVIVAALVAWGMGTPASPEAIGFSTSRSVQYHNAAAPPGGQASAGVFGFSIMFNSPYKLATLAGVIGAIANTLRLELVDLASCPPSIAAFAGALTAGMLAPLSKGKIGYSRISITVPAIVIMVPGLYLYRSYHITWGRLPQQRRILDDRSYAHYPGASAGFDLRPYPH